MTMYVDDIEFIEKSVQDKLNIETVCRACSEFSSVVVLHNTTVLENNNITENQVEYHNPTCTVSNRVLVFSQTRAIDSCPKGLW